MKKSLTIFFFLFIVFNCRSQALFRTVAPSTPVVAGESFRIQYILEDFNKSAPLRPPEFSGFRFIAGPDTYTGMVQSSNGLIPVRNFAYTLEAIRPGKFLIPGATVLLNGQPVKSNDVVLEVISQREAAKLRNANRDRDLSAYYLRPGEDPYEKVRENLFLDVRVDKRECFTGEPVTATFRLCSRLESRSDIVKNPGFYGFTVFDMVSLADKQVTTEIINGKPFDVHIIRKVQLFPLQPGDFSIDAMEVKNRVEFSRSIVNKKTEQEIVEGVLGNPDPEPGAANTETIETDMSTAPLTIRVKPLPAKNKPTTFNGAVGHFSIAAGISKNQLGKNEKGLLEITLRGRGNFMQVGAPQVQWPEGLEGFEPVITDELDKTTSPVSGSRTFRYEFVAARPGSFKISPVVLSYFNPDSGTYRTLRADSPVITVTDMRKITVDREPKATGQQGASRLVGAVTGGLLVLLLISGLILFLRARKNKRMAEVKEAMTEPEPVEEILREAQGLTLGEDQPFFSSLHRAAWNFFALYFPVAGSGMNKEKLFAALRERGIDEASILQAGEILNRCEEGIFTNVKTGTDKQQLLEETRELLTGIRSVLHSEYL